MKFIHFTALDGQAVAMSSDGSVILRPHLEAAEPKEAATVIQVAAGELLVCETMAEAEERLK